MFSFLKKKLPPATHLPIQTDIHSHILPGIDDGSTDLETSIRLIKGLMDLGIRRSVATPHIIGDMYRNSADTIFPAMELLKAELERQQLDFELSAAAEYMLDNYFFELLDNKVLLLTVKDNCILTEFSYSSMPTQPEKMSFAIITEGYAPILAHPERYAYYHNDHRQFHRLQELGFQLQVNLLSLTGYYGKETARAGQYIVKQGLAAYLGTDLHHERHLAALQDSRNLAMFQELFKGKEFNTF